MMYVIMIVQCCVLVARFVCARGRCCLEARIRNILESGPKKTGRNAQRKAAEALYVVSGWAKVREQWGEAASNKAHVEVERHVGARVLVDRERRRRVLDEQVGEADLEFGDLGDFLEQLARDDVAAALERGQRDGPLDPALLLLALLLALGGG